MKPGVIFHRGSTSQFRWRLDAGATLSRERCRRTGMIYDSSQKTHLGLGTRLWQCLAKTTALMGHTAALCAEDTF